MKSFTILTSLLAALATSVNAQVVYNSMTHTLECPYGGHAYCGNYMPLSTNIIIRCYGRRAIPASCDDNLAGISPVGVKTFALCFESEPLAGNAACSYNGIVYPDSGNPFQLPPAWLQFLHNTTNSSMATISTTSTMSLNLPTVYGAPLPTAVSTGIPIAPGSGGYNSSSIAGTGVATPTRPSPPPKPTASFIGGAVKYRSSAGLMIVFAVFVGVWFLS